MAEVIFATQSEGYNKTDVDNYISKLREAYQTAYHENQTISSKYEALMQDYQKLEAEKQGGLNAEVITKVLLDAEILARKIIDEACVEADKITGQAQKNIDRIYDAMGEVVAEAQKLLLSEVDIDLDAEDNIDEHKGNGQRREASEWA
ncbi:MAG: DivIVA domain-containing protein [Firmicutes bacterium]|nr:DivIVA domain-containing protein [Bacillota bacterium]